MDYARIVSLSGDEIDCVDRFKYLGTTISNLGTMNAEIKRRTGIATDAARALTGVWRDTNLSRGIKSLTYQSLVLSKVF